MMDRRTIDLEMQAMEREKLRRLGQRDGMGCIDMNQASKIDGWLQAWQQAYAEAFDVEGPSPPLSQQACGRALKSMFSWIIEEKVNKNMAAVTLYRPWHDAFEATMKIASGELEKPVDEPSSGKPTPGREEEDTLPTLEEFMALNGNTQRAVVRQRLQQETRTADEARQIYSDWLLARNATQTAPEGVLEGADA